MTESLEQMAARLGISLTPKEVAYAPHWTPPPLRLPTPAVPRPSRPRICTLGPPPVLSGVEAARELARSWIRGGAQRIEGQHVPPGWLELGAYQRHPCGVRVREARDPDLRWGLIDRTDSLHRCPA